jgi:AbrB family looped-hinge helix DNA binding protein
MAGVPNELRTSQLTRKGQVTVPAEIRRELGLRRGDKVAFVREGDRVIICPAETVAQRTAGSLRQYRKTPAPRPAEERDAFADAVADEVGNGP